MKVYLAARYSRIAEMRTYRAQLERVGHVVTSRWVDGEHEAENRETHSVQLAGFAQEDFDDVKAADCVISFTELPRGGHSRGGRHVEHGMALAWNKRVVVVGHRENVFHSLPQVEFFETWRDAYIHLTKHECRTCSAPVAALGFCEQCAPRVVSEAELSGANLGRLIKEANARFDALTPERQREHRRAQRKSWVVGETMLSHPQMTREEAERLYDGMPS